MDNADINQRLLEVIEQIGSYSKQIRSAIEDGVVEMCIRDRYPTFKRLALFAASQDNCIPPERWVNWLLEDGSWWLWATDTGREVFLLSLIHI